MTADARRPEAGVRSRPVRISGPGSAATAPAPETPSPSVTAAAAGTSTTAVTVASPSPVSPALGQQKGSVYPVNTGGSVISGAPGNIVASPSASPVRRPQPIAQSSRQLMSATNPLTTATVVGLALTNVVQFAVLMAVSALSAAPPGPFSAAPALRLNGFDIVPSSVEEVTSLYGRWAYMPGAPGFIQGRQTFAVVDPKTGDQVGAFDALVSRGNGIGYTQLLVTSSEGANGDTVDGPVPPAGSLISNLQFGLIGLSHSALPTPFGNTQSLHITTPFGDIPVPFPFDNARGVADKTVDNRPMQLGNGYSIAPAEPVGDTIIATSGIMPGFMTVQGHQAFRIYDSTGQPVGGFTGVFTTTADLFFYTQAVMVTANDGANVGPGPGQVPPVGSVYNVIYFGTDDHYLLYSALPASGGTEVSVIRVNRGKVTTSALTLIDATAPPVATLSGAGDLHFIAASELLPSGVNGLPPREIQIQGYQQFDVYDSAGTRLGTVDADVFRQSDAFGVHSTALLITRVAQGGDDVPPAGSIFNFVSSGASGYGAAHSTVPRPSGNLTSFKLLTPLGDIRLPSTFIPVENRTPVVFYSPFETV